MAKLSNEDYPKPEIENTRERFMKEYKIIDELADRTLSAEPGTVVGCLIKFPIADGFAYYLVKKARPLTLQWIPFGDAWEIPGPYLLGLNLTDVKNILDSARKLHKILNKKGGVK